MRRSIFKRGLSPLNLFRAIFYLPQFIKLYWRLFCDRRVPFYLKTMLAGAFIYFISPVDLIPERANIYLGITDDLVVILLALKYFIKLAPADVVREHMQRIEAEK